MCGNRSLAEVNFLKSGEDMAAVAITALLALYTIATVNDFTTVTLYSCKYVNFKYIICIVENFTMCKCSSSSTKRNRKVLQRELDHDIRHSGQCKNKEPNIRTQTTYN